MDNIPVEMEVLVFKDAFKRGMNEMYNELSLKNLVISNESELLNFLESYYRKAIHHQLKVVYIQHISSLKEKKPLYKPHT